jgi:1-acyl-sn-glycerol-3-phosphate acyltransferase
LPVIPIRIAGLFELKKKGQRLAPPRSVTVTIGAPVQVDQKKSAEEITRELEEKVKKLAAK